MCRSSSSGVSIRTPVLVKMGGVCLFRSRSPPGVVIQLPAFGVADGLAVGLPLQVHQVEPGDALPIGGWVLLLPAGVVGGLTEF